jgi:hypothetical protein
MATAADFERQSPQSECEGVGLASFGYIGPFRLYWGLLAFDTSDLSLYITFFLGFNCLGLPLLNLSVFLSAVEMIVLISGCPPQPCPMYSELQIFWFAQRKVSRLKHDDVGSKL